MVLTISLFGTRMALGPNGKCTVLMERGSLRTLDQILYTDKQDDCIEK